MIGQLVHAFFSDDKLKVALAVIFLDFVLGVLAAVKKGSFRLSYVMDFGKNDVLFKLFPWFVLYAGAFYAGGQDIAIPGLDMGVVAGAAYAVMVAAWVGSILSSLKDLGLPAPSMPALSGGENVHTKPPPEPQQKA